MLDTADNDIPAKKYESHRTKDLIISRRVKGLTDRITEVLAIRCLMLYLNLLHELCVTADYVSKWVKLKKPACTCHFHLTQYC